MKGFNGRHLLREAARRLGESPESQVSYLKRIGVYPAADELALEFHDGALNAKRLLRSQEISEEAYELVERIDLMLVSFSGTEHADKWQAGALQDENEWSAIRPIARELVELLQSPEYDPLAQNPVLQNPVL